MSTTTADYDAETVAEARETAGRLGYVRTKDGRDICQICMQTFEEVEREG